MYMILKCCAVYCKIPKTFDIYYALFMVIFGCYCEVLNQFILKSCSENVAMVINKYDNKVIHTKIYHDLSFTERHHE